MAETVSCLMCNKNYKNQVSYKIHIDAAHKKIKYKCNVCDYEASQIGHLNAHKRSIHEKIRHTCEICKK